MKQRGEFVTQGHLGGYFSGGDPDTTYLKLWDWLLDTLHVQSVLDVGCGDGAAVEAFRVRVTCEGVDGLAPTGRGFFTHDFTLGLWDPGRTYGLVWSCEFVEHVDPKYVDNFLPALASGRWLAMTHAVPGQTGHHHVNCQDSDYWVNQLARYGMVLDPYLTAQARAVASTDAVETNYFARTGLVFERGTA